MPGAMESLLANGSPGGSNGAGAPNAIGMDNAPSGGAQDPGAGVASALTASQPMPQGLPGGGPAAGLMAPQQAGPQQGPQPPQQRPTISHAQTVATLNHLQAFQSQFKRLAKNPKLGKENIRPEIFNATADLIGEGWITLPQVMNEIKSLPIDPPGQKKWVMQHLANTMVARSQILADHAASNPPMPSMADQQARYVPKSNAHADLMSEVARNYKGGG